MNTTDTATRYDELTGEIQDRFKAAGVDVGVLLDELDGLVDQMISDALGEATPSNLRNATTSHVRDLAAEPHDEVTVRDIRALACEVVALRKVLYDVTTGKALIDELRTHRLVVVDGDDVPIIVAHGEPEDFYEPGVHVTEPILGTRASLYAHYDTASKERHGSAGVMVSAHGDVTMHLRSMAYPAVGTARTEMFTADDSSKK